MSIRLQTQRPSLLERGELPTLGASVAIATEEPGGESPRGLKFTRYALYIMLATFGFTLSKAIYAYMGDSVAPTTLEFIFAGIFMTGMYWIGLYESVRPERFKPLLHDPLTVESAWGEVVVISSATGYIYCYIRLMRESWEPPNKPPFELTYFLYFGLPALLAYMAHWRMIGGWKWTEKKRLQDRWDLLCFLALYVLTFIPFSKHYGDRFRGFLHNPGRFFALFLTSGVLLILWFGFLSFVLGNTGRPKSNLLRILREPTILLLFSLLGLLVRFSAEIVAGEPPPERYNYIGNIRF